MLVAITIFWFGFAGVNLLLTVFDSSISALFVCFAISPVTLAQCHSVIYHRFLRLAEVRQFHRRHSMDEM